MLIEQVKKLNPEERFWYWIRERHLVHLRRQAKKPRPWTDDEILQRYFFTNPYRENDKTTVWFRKHVREPLRDDPAVVFATICFRWFNWIPTGELLLREKLLCEWNQRRCVKILSYVGKVFTGAYMIKGSYGERKLDSVCKHITTVWNDREKLVRDIAVDNRLEQVVARLCLYPYLGGFMSYEIACDLRHTYLLENAPDINTWCHLGPGGVRGLMRLNGVEVMPKNKRGLQKRGGMKAPKDWQSQVINLLKRTRSRLNMPLEMREIEHSLCEFDKYERARLGDGSLKRKYTGGPI